MTPAESSCVASCQTEQKAAGAEHHFFDWKGCQAACFPAGTPQEVNIHTAIPPTAAEALAALLVQQAEQQAAMQARGRVMDLASRLRVLTCARYPFYLRRPSKLLSKLSARISR
jgi:hypothetical protein